MKNRLILAAVVVVVIGATSGCVLHEGNSYLKYIWSSTPLYFYDENPSIPRTVIEGFYYPAVEGSWYMEYSASDGSTWWMLYTIERKTAIVYPAPDLYFSIVLTTLGPRFERYETYPVYHAAEVSADQTAVSNSPEPLLGARPSPATREVYETETGRVTLEYGRIE